MALQQMEMSGLLYYWICFIDDEEEGEGLKIRKDYGLMVKDCGLNWWLYELVEFSNYNSILRQTNSLLGGWVMDKLISTWWKESRGDLLLVAQNKPLCDVAIFKVFS
jgi:hypothetical protein